MEDVKKRWEKKWSEGVADVAVPTQYDPYSVGKDGGLGWKVLIHYFIVLLNTLYLYFLLRDFFLDKFSFLD